MPPHPSSPPLFPPCNFSLQSGQHVKVVHGKHEGETGMVVRLDGPVAFLFTDAGQRELRVFTRDLTLAVASTSAADS